MDRVDIQLVQELKKVARSKDCYILVFVRERYLFRHQKSENAVLSPRALGLDVSSESLHVRSEIVEP